jgi:hypothetical protein
MGRTPVQIFVQRVRDNSVIEIISAATYFRQPVTPTSFLESLKDLVFAPRKNNQNFKYSGKPSSHN